MDSFFSLFDPSEGNQNKPSKKTRHKNDQENVRKNPDAPKGRRRGRRSHGKNETLPEESSFLCEPDLSNEILVKDCSYIENYIEVNRYDDDTKGDSEKKPRRRNSGRKNRRKKNKISPAKDILPNTAWQDPIDLSETTLNNQSAIPKICDEKIGKNVNDLKNEDYKKTKRKDNKGKDKDKDGFTDRVYNVIDKLEKVGIKEDMYLAGDFNAEDLESDFFYSSDDMDDFCDDTTSDAEDSGDECYGSLPPEPRFGNVEYKLQLVSPCERRFQHLVTQLKWRLRSGGGSAVYVVGVRDCGALRGLRAGPLRASLRALRSMANAIGAVLASARTRRVAPNRAVAEVYIRKLADTQQSVELRVAVMGANEAGKSTLIGVLTQGELDNGRGSARLNMFRHLHEVKSGRTSSLSHEILGFDAQGNVVNYGCSELMTAERIGERSAKLVSFLDLAGHSKYQRTTLHGLTGYSPHYAMLVISATAGITRITEEHIGLLLALDMPFFAVINKCELANIAVTSVVQRLAQLLEPANRKPLLITDENLARNCVVPQKSILDAIDSTTDTAKEDELEMEVVPVFPVSCVRGAGLNSLHAYLLALQPPGDSVQHKPEDETCEFQIDEIFHVGESTGPVVGGLLARGQLHEGDNLIIGPLDTGEFVEISVKTIYRNRVPCGSVKAGQSASLGLSHYPPNLRQGMVLLAVPDKYKCGDCDKPTFGGCPPGKCKGRQINKLVQTSQNIEKNRKNARRQNKNILQDIANVQNNLTKTIDKGAANIQNIIIDKDIPNFQNKTNSMDEKDITNIEKRIIDKHKEATNLQKIDKNATNLQKLTMTIEKNPNMYTSDDDSEYVKDVIGCDSNVIVGDDVCVCDDVVLLEDPNDPRGCIYFQASVHVLRHSTAIYPGFQCSVHVGNVRQTAIIEGIMSPNNVLRAGEAAPVIFRFARCPEYLVKGRRLLFTAGLGTRAIGRVTQTFPYVP
ncbi:GTP-binding protein 2-like isoform X2 [Maniola jurtina]|uniref:GTP-binding protein 2-like isoform X2 n=1 Tax=Maniola jurtina TaxID=191418 RepID=UPI001E68FC10|nr:GTP-binding protein 2-like isoform X2 [Maniola jurtina]